MKEYKNSKLSISKYTKSVGIPEATFRGWINKENEIEFGEINIKEETRDEKESNGKTNPRVMTFVLKSGNEIKCKDNKKEQGN